MFPYPEIRNEELEEMTQFVAPVEKFYSEEGLMITKSAEWINVNIIRPSLMIPS